MTEKSPGKRGCGGAEESAAKIREESPAGCGRDGDRKEGRAANSIEIQDVFAGYGKNMILQGVNLEVPAGRITTLIGCNGSGKSTLLRAVLGFVPLKKGIVRIDGRSAAELSGTELSRKIAYLSQGKNVPDISVGRMVLHGRFPHLDYPRRYGEKDYAAAEEAMEQMGILHLARRPLSQLSGGMRQKVYIAMALAGHAPVIAMDEPTTYLDIGQQFCFAGMAKQLAEDGKTLLLVLHDLLLALKISDRIAVMQEGRIVRCGTPEEILESDAAAELYGVRVGTVRTGGGIQYYYEEERHQNGEKRFMQAGKEIQEIDMN